VLPLSEAAAAATDTVATGGGHGCCHGMAALLPRITCVATKVHRRWCERPNFVCCSKRQYCPAPLKRTFMACAHPLFFLENHCLAQVLVRLVSIALCFRFQGIQILLFIYLFIFFLYYFFWFLFIPFLLMFLPFLFSFFSSF
jgi:hypothetical protein